MYSSADTFAWCGVWDANINARVTIFSLPPFSNWFSDFLDLMYFGADLNWTATDVLVYSFLLRVNSRFWYSSPTPHTHNIQCSSFWPQPIPEPCPLIIRGMVVQLIILFKCAHNVVCSFSNDPRNGQHVITYYIADYCRKFWRSSFSAGSNAYLGPDESNNNMHSSVLMLLFTKNGKTLVEA